MEKVAAEEEQEEAWAWSWGAGTDGQLGNGGFEDYHLPQKLLLPSGCRGRVSFVAGGGAHAIALTSDGEVFTWGRGTHGQLGHGNVESIRHPTLVKLFENHIVTCVSAGWNHSGFATDNSVYGFGSARRRQVGKCVSRNQKSYNIPTLIDGFPNCKIANIYANGDHSAALDESGQLYVWGRALVGEHDDDKPRAIFPTLSISQVALGWHHALVLSGELYTIGAYHHQKCDPPVSENAVAQQSSYPIETDSMHAGSSSLSNIEKAPTIHGEQLVQIAAGTEHSAFVTDQGAVFTWGWGEHGQLGLGDTCDQMLPQRVNLGDKRSCSSASLGVYCGSGFTIAVNLLSYW